MSALVEGPIRMRELLDEGFPHPPAWGRFSGGELIYVIATMPNGRARSWSREVNEPCEIFAARMDATLSKSCAERLACCLRHRNGALVAGQVI